MMKGEGVKKHLRLKGLTKLSMLYIGRIAVNLVLWGKNRKEAPKCVKISKRSCLFREKIIFRVAADVLKGHLHSALR